MYGQKRVLEGIRSFSPAREHWASRPPAELPARVAVTFDSGQTGILDMKDPRAAHWARMIDDLQRTNQPVYVEIDEETTVITNVRVPRTFRIERLEPDDHENLLVWLRPSSAVHLLLRSDPNFASMEASLRAALADGSERLITETRDEHEIIDVRKPGTGEGGGAGPAPPPPPDPPVSEARAGDVFSNMNGESCSPCSPSSDCIPFLYPDDGCWIRAHMMCHLMRAGGPNTTTNPPEDPEKVWIDFAGLQTVPTVNHPDCYVRWGWHVAPTLLVSAPGGNEKRVIDPSLCDKPVSLTDWRNRQDPGAHLDEGPWTDWNSFGDGLGPSYSFAQASQDPFMTWCRHDLQDRCLDVGPPPYSCTRGCFFIVDRSTFSDDEIEAMLLGSSPAVIQAAFYVVVDGFSPDELGFTAATMQKTPALNIAPLPAGMTITPQRLAFEDSTHLNRRQRLTWVYDISFTDTSAFTSALLTVTLQASMSSVSATAHLYLITQPNPYENDGEICWLSTDLRVFQIETGQSMFGAGMGSDPSAFISQVIANLNTGNTGGQTFDASLSTDQETSRLELSGTVGGVPIFNFAVAKVRYRSLYTVATDVRVFFRLFPAATTSLEYDQATTYRRHAAGGTVIPLLGIKNNEVAAVPCFASPRIDSAAASMTTQTDTPNVRTIPAGPTGAEVVRYFGCWLDINQTQPQFPIQPTPVDGPYTSGRKSIQELIRNEHQCLVSEIAFAPAPAQNGSTPSVSDKLAQRNLAIVESANPGLEFSRRIPQTFEIRPSSSKVNHDELMVDWGNVPRGSVATFYLPGLDVDEIRLLAARNHRTHRLVRIDEHTLRCDTGGILYLPIPFVDGNLPGMLTIDLPEGVKKGQVFKVVVRQVTDEPQRVPRGRAEAQVRGGRHIVGSFQLTIPVRAKAEILPGQQRLLSNLRWIERAIPPGNRWAPVFGRYVTQVAGRVDALGGNSKRVAPSSSGQWEQAYRTCLLLALLAVALIAVLVVGSGTLAGGVVVLAGVPAVALLAGTLSLWRNACRPTTCQLLRALLAGAAIGALILAVLLLLGRSTPQLIAALVVGVGVAIAAAIGGWLKRCY
jgi:hypothetical protein